MVSFCKGLLLTLSGTPQLCPRPPKFCVFSMVINYPCSGDGDKYASWEDVDIAAVQFLTLDRVDGSLAIVANDFNLGDMLEGGTSQVQ